MSTFARNRRSGLTLIEVMIATALFTIGMLAAFMLATQMRRITAFTGDFAMAAEHAEATIEALRLQPYDSVTPGGATNGIYNLSWTVNSPTSTSYKVVAVTASWKDTQGQPHSAGVNTIIHE